MEVRPMAITTEWPDEMSWTPSEDELEQERGYWQDLARIAEYDAWVETQAEAAILEDFSNWPLSDLLDELDMVRTLTPDQEDIIQEIEAAIAQKRAA
jgi:hypothetical protein